jgi:hypothetical protein
MAGQTFVGKTLIKEVTAEFDRVQTSQERSGRADCYRWANGLIGRTPIEAGGNFVGIGAIPEPGVPARRFASYFRDTTVELLLGLVHTNAASDWHLVDVLHRS